MTISSQQPMVAIFIDADNVSHQFADKIMERLAVLGDVVVRRIYANWSKPQVQGWYQPIIQYGFVAIQQFDHVAGKNSSDIAITIDVLDWLYTKQADIFCLVSSDSDFTPLCLKLREHGKMVVGMGHMNSSKSLVQACTKFHYLLKEMPITMPEKSTPQTITANNTNNKSCHYPNPNHDKELIGFLHALIDTKHKEGLLNIAHVGQALQASAFSTHHYGYNKLSEFLRSLEDFEVVAQDATLFLKKKVCQTHDGLIHPSMAMVNDCIGGNYVVEAMSAKALTKDTALTNAIGAAIALHQQEGWAKLESVSDYLYGTFGMMATDYGYQDLWSLLKNLTLFTTKKVHGVCWVKDTRFDDVEQTSDVCVASQKLSKQQLQQDKNLLKALDVAVADNVCVDNLAKMDAVGNTLCNMGLSAKTYGYKNWSELFRVIELFELQMHEGHLCIKHPKMKCLNAYRADQLNSDKADKILDELVELLQDVETGHAPAIDKQALQKSIADAIKTIQDGQGWAKVSEVGAVIKKLVGIGSQALGYRTFADLLATLEGCELQKKGRIWWVCLAG